MVVAVQSNPVSVFKKKAAQPTASSSSSLPPRRAPTFNSVFALVTIDEITFTRGSDEIDAFVLSLTCSDPETQAALQRGVNEINNWVYRTPAGGEAPDMATLTCLTFAMMADMSFVVVGSPNLQCNHARHPRGDLLTIQHFMFTRAPLAVLPSPAPAPAPAPAPSSASAPIATSVATTTPE